MVFQIDGRAIAVFRVVIGAIMICDAFDRLQYCNIFYGTHGIYPISVAMGELGNSRSGNLSWSLNFLNVSTAFQTLLILSYGVCGAFLLAGFHTRWATIVGWVLLVSLQTRIPAFGNAGDTVLRLYLFWGLFLSLEGRCSLDSLRQKVAGPKMVKGAPAAGLMLQIAFIYLFSAFFKADPVWREDLVALQRVLSLESFALPLASPLLERPELLAFLTRSSVILQELAPFLVFSPVYRTQLRIIIPLAMIGFHLFGIGLTLAIGLFPIISAAGWIIFLPPIFWDKIQNWGTKLGLFSHLPRSMDPEESSEARGPAPGRAARYRSTVIWLLIGYVFLWNLTTVSRMYFGWLANDAFEAPGYAMRINQRWALFAPKPRTRDGWYVSNAKLEDGSVVDLIMNGDPVSFEKPESLREYYGGMRPRKYLLEMFHGRRTHRIEAYTDYLKRQWARQHPENPVMDLELFFMLKDSLHPEDGIVKIQVFPMNEFDERGRSVFRDDFRKHLPRQGD